MTKIPVAKVKDNFSNILRRAGKEEIVVTVHGRPVAVIIGFENEDGFFGPKERGPQNDRGPALSSPNTDIWLHGFVYTAPRES